MKPTNCSSKNYVAHGIATTTTTTTVAAAAADDDDGVLTMASFVSQFLIHEHGNCGHDITPTYTSSITTLQTRACFQENWAYGITHKPSFITIKEMTCDSIIQSQTKGFLLSNSQLLMKIVKKGIFSSNEIQWTKTNG